MNKSNHNSKHSESTSSSRQNKKALDNSFAFKYKIAELHSVDITSFDKVEDVSPNLASLTPQNLTTSPKMLKNAKNG